MYAEDLHIRIITFYWFKFLHRQIITPPTLSCYSSHEGKSYHKAANADTAWICKSKEWIPYKYCNNH